MYIYCGNSLADCSAPALPSPRYPCVHHDGIQVLRRERQTLGLRVRLSITPSTSGVGGSFTRLNGGQDAASNSSVHTTDILFGDSVQDVVSSIGAPAKTFYKSEDKMKIHSPNAYRKAAMHKSDYFYNYNTLGFVRFLSFYL